MNIYFCYYNFNGSDNIAIVREETLEKAVAYHRDSLSKRLSIPENASIFGVLLDPNGPTGYIVGNLTGG